MWSQVAMMLLGIWLMVAPGVLDFSKKIADNAHIAGPLIATFSMVAIWECTRNVRLFNLPLAVWLLAAPVVLQYDNDTALMNDYAVAILIILLSIVKPKRKHRFGGGWPAIWKCNALHSREAAAADRKFY
jgi:hypothetical protein